MSRTFENVGLGDFPGVVAAFPWTRRITEVHLHHTWRPTQADYNGHATIVGMWRHHTVENGWSDIGQHVTVAPDGKIWLCRNFNWAPASAVGFNGNSAAGPFMIEMIGDFDHGRETLKPAQKTATLGVIKAIQEKFGLKPADLRFHNEMSSKSCPGESIGKEAFIRDIRDFEPPASAAGRGGARNRGGDMPFPQSASRAFDAVRSMVGLGAQTDDMSTAEHGVGLSEVESRSRARGGGAGDTVTDEMIVELGDHVINLTRGRFSDSGRLSTSEGDVDRIFEEKLTHEIAQMKAKHQKARLLFYAHGGLVSESNALYGAYQQLKFWRDNGVYPVFFIWETGLAETLRQLLAEPFARILGTRGGLSAITDNLIEEAARALQGGRIWDGMKSSAERASGPEGGARYAANKAADLLAAHRDDLDIHDVGHSAGAIFNAHFMRALVSAKASIKTAHFLAPAIRNDVFRAEVAPLLGKGIGPLTIFTMKKPLEKSDTVASLYRKSLLYLIHEALEDERGEPILGLEASLRADGATKEIFGLSGKASAKGEVVWSRSDDIASGAASRSVTHGGFDNDEATMVSVARRILNRVSGEPIAPFPPGARAAADFWTDQVDWPESLADWISAAVPPQDSGTGGAAPGATAAPEQRKNGQTATGRRGALCIGIDRYPRMPLAGCVADAKLWARTLGHLGYQTTLLTDEAATADAIRKAIAGLVGGAMPGDSIVVQYAGHGTQFIDRDGDEAGGDTPAEDECLCAVDCEGSGVDGLVIDDEIKLIFDGLAAGVELTVFFDCCHSGTATRAALRVAAATGARDGGATPRYLPPSPTMTQAYQTRLALLKRNRARAPTSQKDVLFSACTSTQLAYESSGQGDFTRQATALLAKAAGLSNRDFLEGVLKAFGSGARQTPELHCDVGARDRRFLGL